MGLGQDASSINNSMPVFDMRCIIGAPIIPGPVKPMRLAVDIG